MSNEVRAFPKDGMPKFTAEDGKDYFVVMCSDAFYQEYLNGAWNETLARAKKQLSRLQYVN